MGFFTPRIRGFHVMEFFPRPGTATTGTFVIGITLPAKLRNGQGSYLPEPTALIPDLIETHFHYIIEFNTVTYQRARGYIPVVIDGGNAISRGTAKILPDDGNILQITHLATCWYNTDRSFRFSEYRKGLPVLRKIQAKVLIFVCAADRVTAPKHDKICAHLSGKAR